MRLYSFEDIGRAVGAAALEKATTYQRRRRAFVIEIAEDGSRIEGRVQGTQRRPCAVTIALGGGADGRATIDGSCSCPVGFNC